MNCPGDITCSCRDGAFPLDCPVHGAALILRCSCPAAKWNRACPVHGTHRVGLCLSLHPDSLVRCGRSTGHDGGHVALPGVSTVSTVTNWPAQPEYSDADLTRVDPAVCCDAEHPNLGGVRCDHTLGHDGEHGAVLGWQRGRPSLVSWTDAEHLRPEPPLCGAVPPRGMRVPTADDVSCDKVGGHDGDHAGVSEILSSREGAEVRLHWAPEPVSERDVIDVVQEALGVVLLPWQAAVVRDVLQGGEA